MRIFVAIPLDKTLRGRIHQVQEHLRPHFVGARWVPVQQLHLTLKFLGEIQPEQAARLRDGLSVSLAGCAPFSLDLEKLGAFPKLTLPKVLWLGAGKGAEGVQELHQLVEKEAALLGVPLEEKEFRPHVTLGRLKGDREGPPGWERMIGDLPSERVERVQIIESRLTPKGPVYSLFAEIPLKAKKGD